MVEAKKEKESTPYFFSTKRGRLAIVVDPARNWRRHLSTHI